ncbi:MAG: YcxB family protein [Chloroflexota bacterium]|nr:YcxB family protein [Chloroflexota bacterium]
MTKYNFSRTRTLVSTGISLVVVSGLLIVYVLLSPPSEVLTNLLLVISFLLVLFLLVVFLRWRIRSRSNRNPELQGEHIITISPEGLRHRTNQVDSLVSWGAIETITTDTYGLYFIRLSSRRIAHAVPRRAFATPHDAQAFLALAQTYWTNGRAMPLTGTGCASEQRS